MNAKRFSGFSQLWKPIAGLLGLLVIIIWTTGIWRDRMEPGTAPHTPGSPLPSDAQILTAHLEMRPARIDLVGSVSSDNQVTLSARVSAYVADVQASAGDAVKRNDLLLQLDDRDLRAKRESAQAELRRAQSEYTRVQRLHETQAATEQQLVAARTAFESARAQTEQAEVLLSFSVIQAPMDGRVTDRHVEIGQLVHPGQPLFDVYDPTVMRLDVPVPVRLVDYLSLGTRLPIQLERPDIIIEGVVHRIVSGIDPKSRTQTVQLLLDTEVPVLPGTFGRLSIGTRERETVRLPVHAVYRVGQLEMVDVVQNQRRLRRLVTTGPVHDGWIEILSGLTAGEEVLISEVER